jgi:hypothetical protein
MYFGNKGFETYLKFLHEVYFEKTDTLKKMEDSIGKIREGYGRYKDNSATKEVQEFNRLMESQFGMEVFALQIETSSEVNAYTITIASRFDMLYEDDFASLVELDKKKGYRFVKDNGLCVVVVIYGGLLTNPNLTNAEILAVILHEVGHNFADFISNDLRIYNANYLKQYLDLTVIDILLNFGVKAAIGFSAFKKTNNNEYVKEVEKNRKYRSFEAFKTGVKNKIEDNKNSIKSFLYRLTGGINFRIQKLGISYDSLEKNSIRKQDEIIADKFATINGYGPELQSALAKMTLISGRQEKFVEKIPFIGALINLSYAQALDDIYKFDEHPQLMQRINSSLSALEFELKKKDIDPKLKKVIQSQIDDIKKLKEEVTKEREDGTKAERYRANYNKIVEEEDKYSITKEMEDKLNNLIDKFGK